MNNFLGTEIAIVFILILANSFFAASEIAIVSVRRSRLQQQIDAGKKNITGAQMALELSQHPDRFLATVQVGITLISTLASAFGGASISQPLAQWFGTFPILKPYADPLALAVVVAFITYFSLVLGELVPKRLALQSAERIASAVAPFMVGLSSIAHPAVAFLTGSANLVLRLLGQAKGGQNTVTEEDIVYLTHEGTASGNVEKEEEELINRVFRFTDRQVSAVMMPRTEIVAIELGTSLKEAIEIFLTSGFTRIPLYKDSLDNVVGILYAKDLLRANFNNENVDLMALARPPFFISVYQHVDDLMATFRRRGIHLAIVIDEYSQVIGLVTLEDVLEELVGEIQDEYDTPQASAFILREDGSWLVDGLANHETVREKIGLQQPPEDRGDYHTLAGMLMAHLGRIPKEGDTVTIGDFTLEVVDMDGRRIDKVLIRRKT